MGNLFNQDFLEFIDCLNKSEAEYLLVGGYSVVIHGYPRTTGDLDIWVKRSESNYNKLLKAFDLFRLPVFDMTLENFLDVNKFDVFRFGRQPVAIDIITDLKGLDFSKSLEGAQSQEFDQVRINYLNFQDLIRAKKASGRAKDINDIENLMGDNS